MTAATDQKAKARDQNARHQYGHLAKSIIPTDLPPDEKAETNGRLTLVKWAAIVTIGLVLVWGTWVFWQPISEFLALLGDQETVSAAIQSYGVLGPFVLALAQVMQVLVAIIPGHVFLVAAGYVYGFLAGFVMNITYVVVASQLGFLLARRFGRPVVNRLVKSELVDKWEKIAEERGFMFFTIAFVLPVFPTDAMNFVAGLTGMSPRKFLAANFLGRLPSAVMLTLIGSHGLSLPNYAWWIMGAIVAGLYIGGRMAITRIEQRYSRRQMQAEATAD